MTLADDAPVQFSQLEQPELAEYRPVNRCALVAFVMGLISALALTHPLLCVLPLIGIVLAVQSLRQIGLNEIRQSGRPLAVTGLVLSLLFGSWALAWESSRDRHLFSQARRFSEQWFELLRQGKAYEAHQLTAPEEVRAAAGVDLKEFYAEDAEKPRRPPASDGPEIMVDMLERPSVEFGHFFRQPLLQQLREAGDAAQYEFRENLNVLDHSGDMAEISLVFSVHEEKQGKSETFPIVITLMRHLKPGLAADWRVLRVTRADSSL